MWKITKKQEGMLSRFQGTFDIPFSKRWVEVMAHWKKVPFSLERNKGPKFPETIWWFDVIVIA